MRENQFRSEFRGSAWGLLGYSMLFTLCLIGSIFTLGYALAWWFNKHTAWRVRNTVINGHSLDFDGKPRQIWGTVVSNALLILITVGLFVFYAQKRMYKWEVKHTIVLN